MQVFNNDLQLWNLVNRYLRRFLRSLQMIFCLIFVQAILSFHDNFWVNVYFRPLILPRAITRLNLVTLLYYFYYKCQLGNIKITVGRIRGRKYTLTNFWTNSLIFIFFFFLLERSPFHLGSIFNLIAMRQFNHLGGCPEITQGKLSLPHTTAVT